MEIGVHCSLPSCNKLDFLPFKCEQCLKTFCKDHRLPDQHECKPCGDHQSHYHPGNQEATMKELRSFNCSLPGCKRREMIAVKCAHCDTVFCLQHRHREDHNCPTTPSRQAQGDGPRTTSHKAADLARTLTGGHSASQAQQTKGWSATKAAKLEPMKAKVLLMKLKMKAEGSDAVPMSERVYYNVELPGGAGGSPDKPMFFSREWSVGKVVDFVAQKNGLRNSNNRPSSGQQLILLDTNGDRVEMSQLLKSLLNSTLPSGGKMVLKYVSVCAQ